MDTPAIACVLPASMQLLSSAHLTTLWSSHGHIYRLRVRLGATSVDGAILRKKGGDEELLGYYHQELMLALNARGVADAKLFTLQVLKEQFEVALVDWMRFMAGWGRWGNVGWVDSNVRSFLKKWAETPQ